jgi:hypothetical protein
MPAKDIYHDCVKNALVKDNWTITHDPLTLKWGTRDMYVDLGAQKLIAAEKAERKIAVEIKSFAGASEINELEKAIGQYIVYHDVLAETQPDRELYVAVHDEIYEGLFEEAIGKLLLRNNRVKLIVFQPQKEVILQWIA